MSDGLGSESYQYDLLGRLTNVAKIVSGNTYSVGYGYNNDDTVNSITYPSGRVVTPGYDSVGRLQQIASGGTNLLSNMGYNGANLASGLNYGNGVQGQFGYNDHLQIYTLKYTQGATDLLDLTYGYGTSNNGQIQGITDNVNSAHSTQYSYDPWSRLSLAQTVDLSSSNTWKLQFDYDRYGNRLDQNLVGGVGTTITAPQLTVNAANNRVITTGYNYDAAGNMTGDSINTYGYDGENRIVTVNGAASASYDGNGLRVKKGSTTYIYSGTQPIAEYNGTSLVTEYVYGPSGLLATIAAGGSPVYSIGDHLSARLQMDAVGTTTRTYGHFPFGETWYEQGTASKWKFTSYERDSDTNLDYAIHRAYSSRLGRFMQPDPYAGSMDFRNPQSLNRYAYLSNNVLTSVDPLGEGPIPPAFGYSGDPSSLNSGCNLDGFATPCPIISDMMGGDTLLFFHQSGGTTNPAYSGTDADGTAVFAFTTAELGYWVDIASVQGSSSNSWSDLMQGLVQRPAADNTRMPWYKNPCVQSALAKGAAITALDLIGTLPEGGTIAAAFSMFHGAAGVSNGNKILGRVAFAGTILSTAGAGHDLQGKQDSAVSTTITGLQAAAGGAGIAKGLIEDIPVAGQVFAALSVGLDLLGTGVEVYNCHP